MRRFTRAVPVLLLVAPIAALLCARRSQSLPLYAARTGNLCMTCHFDPNGGGPRNLFGFAYARNRHSLNAEDSTSEWGSLEVTNQIGESMPVFLGLNHRFMLLANTTTQSDSIDRAAFFNMENALHIAFQPHRKLTLVYTRDGSRSKEAFGMIGGLPWNGYIKGGQFRNPFGLRLDDHTVATRNGFLDFYSASVVFLPWAPLASTSYLPFDPRQVDTGLEVGGEHNGWYARLSLTNGNSNLFAGSGVGNPYAETKAVKLGANRTFGSLHYQSALSFYDDYQKEPVFVPKRATRWAYAGLFGFEQWAVLGEIGAGTDQVDPSTGAGQRKVNRLAGWAEVDYAPLRSVNFRARYDYMNLNRDPSVIAPQLTLAELNTHARYSVEGEYVPVPFAELRWSVRRIDHKASQDPLGFEIADETQGLLQLHFSY